jgi:hypothetical protein
MVDLSLLNISAAVAKWGDVTIALVCPLDDSPSIYHQTLPNPNATFHHWTVETNALSSEIRRLEQSGHTLACEGVVDVGQGRGIAFAYIDMRREAGGYLELLEIEDKASKT